MSIFNSHQNIIVKSHPENIGISGGLRIGLQSAILQNYDFLWTFDQDSQPEPDVLEKLISYYDQLTSLGKKVGIIAPLPIDCKTGQIWHGIVFEKYRFIESPISQKEKIFYKCDAVITSGSLVSLTAAQNTSLPEEGFFIDAVDWEYCLKFQHNNYEIYVIKDAVLKHRFGESQLIKTILTKREVAVYHYSSLRYYYMCRNHTFVETRLAAIHHSLFRSILHRLKFLVIILVKIIFYEPPFSWLKIWACLRGTYDGFLGSLGKNW
jgi:rhamnosyltransferase